MRLDLVFNKLGWKTRKSPRSTSSIAGLTPQKLHSTEIRESAAGIRFGQWIVLSRQLGSVSQSLAVALFLHLLHILLGLLALLWLSLLARNSPQGIWVSYRICPSLLLLLDPLIQAGQCKRHPMLGVLHNSYLSSGAGVCSCWHVTGLIGILLLHSCCAPMCCRTALAASTFQGLINGLWAIFPHSIT